MTGTNFALNLATSTSLNFVWGLIHSLEIVASFFLLTLRMPQNSFIVYEMIYNIANFSFMPPDFNIVPYGDTELGLDDDDDDDETPQLRRLNSDAQVQEV